MVAAFTELIELLLIGPVGVAEDSSILLSLAEGPFDGLQRLLRRLDRHIQRTHRRFQEAVPRLPFHDAADFLPTTLDLRLLLGDVAAAVLDLSVDFALE